MDQHGIPNMAHLEALHALQAGLRMPVFPNQARGLPAAQQNMIAGAQRLPNHSMAGLPHQRDGIPAGQGNLFAGFFAGPPGLPAQPMMPNQGHGPAQRPNLRAVAEVLPPGLPILPMADMPRPAPPMMPNQGNGVAQPNLQRDMPRSRADQRERQNAHPHVPTPPGIPNMTGAAPNAELMAALGYAPGRLVPPIGLPADAALRYGPRGERNRPNPAHPYAHHPPGFPNLAGNHHPAHGAPADAALMADVGHRRRGDRHAPAHHQHTSNHRIHDPAYQGIPPMAPAPAHMRFPPQPSHNLPHDPHFPTGAPHGTLHGQYGFPPEFQPHGFYFNTPDGPRLFPNPTIPMPPPNPQDIQLLQMEKQKLKDQLKNEQDANAELRRRIENQKTEHEDKEVSFNREFAKLQQDMNKNQRIVLLAQAAKANQSDKTTDCQDLPAAISEEPAAENGTEGGQFSIASFPQDLEEMVQKNKNQQGTSDDSSSLSVPTSSDDQLAPRPAPGAQLAQGSASDALLAQGSAPDAQFAQGSAPATPPIAASTAGAVVASPVTVTSSSATSATPTDHAATSPPSDDALLATGPALATSPTAASTSSALLVSPVTANSSSAATTVQPVSPEVTRRTSVNSLSSEDPLAPEPALATSPTVASTASSSSATPTVQPSASVTPAAKKSSIWTPHAETLPHSHRAFTRYFTARRKFKKEAGVPALLDPVSLEYAQLRKEADDNFATNPIYKEEILKEKTDCLYHPQNGPLPQQVKFPGQVLVLYNKYRSIRKDLKLPEWSSVKEAAGEEYWKWTVKATQLFDEFIVQLTKGYVWVAERNRGGRKRKREETEDEEEQETDTRTTSSSKTPASETDKYSPEL